jgi:hypothetical protein
MFWAQQLWRPETKQLKDAGSAVCFSTQATEDAEMRRFLVVQSP